MSSLPTPPLCVADDATFWPWLRWPQFAAFPHKEKTLVVIPIAGFADHGLGASLDAEEQVLTHVLRDASQQRGADESLLVLPPVRFVLGPVETCAFAVTPPEAHAMLEELVGSVAAAGFRRVLLLNASPWNEELIDAAARDLRIDRGLQMFCINLAALGLDFNAMRDPAQQSLRAILATLPQSSPQLVSAAKHLAALFTEIHARPPLPHGGVIPPISAP